MPKSFIGDKEITHEKAAISLVRKFDKDHSFLVLEKLDKQGNREMKQAHLFIKEDSNNKKAIIVYKDIDLDALKELSEGCHAITWTLDRDGANYFKSLVEFEVNRSAQGKIDYVITGNSKINGLFGDSLEQSNLDNAKKQSEQTNNMYMASLLTHGHNCFSWADAMITALQLEKKQDSWKAVLVKRPMVELKGQVDGDKIRRHGCIIL